MEINSGTIANIGYFKRGIMSAFESTTFELNCRWILKLEKRNAMILIKHYYANKR